MRYIDFLDLNYEPKKDDVICDFFVEPKGIGLEEATGAVAAESSIGTWTELKTEKPYVRRLHAKVFRINGNDVKIAYSVGLFEPGNMPNILSSIAGNVFGLKALKNLRLNDVTLPSRILESFRGPKYGILGIRKLLDIPKRPLVGTIIKPKLGLRTEDHAKVAYDAWVGGCDLVKDDENLSNQGFNPFRERVLETLRQRDRAEKETGERKAYLVNITSETSEMVERAKFVVDSGGEYVMVDILTCGFSALQTLRNKDFDLVIHAHRAGHAAFTKNPRHGISMLVISKLARVVGIDQIHVGAVVGKMSEVREEVLKNCSALRDEMDGLKRALPVASGGLHPRLIPSLIKIFGNDFVIQAGGGIHGHRDGTVSGARAMRQALDATMHKTPLKEYAKTHKELETALKIWK
ncbi:MAG: type III ribulose-bisphosphate carboxylase [Nitrososphaerales archaeon]